MPQPPKDFSARLSDWFNALRFNEARAAARIDRMVFPPHPLDITEGTRLRIVRPEQPDLYLIVDDVDDSDRGSFKLAVHTLDEGQA